jgi:hypothetical protein
MCFSATASFGASAIILGIGIVALTKSTTIPQKIFSSIPLIFAVQQFAEGILWLSLAHSSAAYWAKTATYTFLVLAEVVWPIMVPLSIMLLENRSFNRKILRVLTGLGVLVSAYLLYSLLSYKVQASISCSHILYDVSYPPSAMRADAFYFAVAVVAPIISSVKRVRLLGLVICLSYIVTKIFYEDYLISIWCYFATAISIIVLSIVIQLNKPPKPYSGSSVLP